MLFVVHYLFDTAYWYLHLCYSVCFTVIFKCNALRLKAFDRHINFTLTYLRSPHNLNIQRIPRFRRLCFCWWKQITRQMRSDCSAVRRLLTMPIPQMTFASA